MEPGLPLWYAVHCKPQKEAQVADALESGLGLAVYLPEVTRQVRGRAHRAPLFPRYLFVQADLRRVARSTIDSTPGAIGLVAFGREPQPIPASVVAAICEQVDHWNAQGGRPGHLFQPGDAVRLTGGPLAGLQAVFLASLKPGARARVLLDFLGRLSAVIVDVDRLEKDRAAPPPPRPRRTRGTGRPMRGHEQ